MTEQRPKSIQPAVIESPEMERLEFRITEAIETDVPEIWNSSLPLVKEILSTSQFGARIRRTLGTMLASDF